MNQIRSDRDTKTHMLVQPVCFIISLLLFCSLFFFQTAHLSVILLDTGGPKLFTLTGWFFGRLGCQRGTFLHAGALTGVAGQLHRHEWAKECSSLPSPLFSISSSLPL